MANSRKPGLLGHFGHFGQNCHFGHFGQPFPNQGGHAEKKCHSKPCLHQPDQATFGFGGVYTHRKPGKLFYCRGCATMRAELVRLEMMRRDDEPPRMCTVGRGAGTSRGGTHDMAAWRRGLPGHPWWFGAWAPWFIDATRRGGSISKRAGGVHVARGEAQG